MVLLLKSKYNLVSKRFNKLEIKFFLKKNLNKFAEEQTQTKPRTVVNMYLNFTNFIRSEKGCRNKKKFLDKYFR